MEAARAESGGAPTVQNPLGHPPLPNVGMSQQFDEFVRGKSG